MRIQQLTFHCPQRALFKKAGLKKQLEQQNTTKNLQIISFITASFAKKDFCAHFTGSTQRAVAKARPCLYT